MSYANTRTSQQAIYCSGEVGVHTPPAAAEQLHRSIECRRRGALQHALPPAAAPPRLLIAQRHTAESKHVLDVNQQDSLPIPINGLLFA